MIISAYIGENRFNGLRNNDAQKLTHVNFAFAVVREGRASVAHWKNAETVRAFLRGKGSIAALLSVGGWGAGGFSPAVATAEGREKLAQSLAEIITDFGFDGVDLDWEYPCSGVAGIESSPDDTVNYTALVRLLRDKLGKKLITMAAGASEACARDLELTKLNELMDFFNIMTYDMARWDIASHHTSLYPSALCRCTCGDKAIQVYREAGLPAEKMTLGAAFYARVYQGVDGINGQPEKKPPGFSGGYRDTLLMAEAAGGVLYDEKAEAPYAYNKKDKIFITFDNERSLRAKREYAIKNGLAGLMFWEYSCDTEESTLLNALALT